MMCLLLLSVICFYLYTSVLAFEAKLTHFRLQKVSILLDEKKGKRTAKHVNTDSNKILYDYFFFCLEPYIRQPLTTSQDVQFN